MKRAWILSVVLAFIAVPLLAGESPSSPTLFKNTERKSGGMILFRGAVTWLPEDRGREVFTDTKNITGAGENDRSCGWSLAAGLDLDIGHELLFSDLFGEIFLEYAQHSKKRVLQTTSALLGGTRVSRVTVSQLSVAVAPKLRWKLDCLRPWLIPAGVAFLVSSPPSNDTTVLDVGMHFGAGVDWVVFEPFSLGVDVRYTLGFGDVDTENDYLSAGVYLGIDF